MNKLLAIDELNIHNFRGLNGLTLDDLSNVNIFAGANNSGKTSVLEALKILSSPTDMGQIVRLALLRAQVSSDAKRKNLVNYMLSIFQKVTDEDHQSFHRIKLGVSTGDHYYAYEADGTTGEIIESTGSEKRVLDLAIKTSVDNLKVSYKSVQIVNGDEAAFSPIERPLFSALYLHASVSYYRTCVGLLSSYIIQEGKHDIIHILKTFDPHIDDISIVGEDIYLHSTHSGTMPLFAYGSGLQKAVVLTAAIMYCKNGVILVDEIDNAIHVSAFKDVFQWFLSACLKWNVQAFVTTHSAEAIDAILEVVHSEYSKDDILRIVTLRKDPKSGITRKKVRSGEDAYHDRTLFRTELRL